MAEDTERDGARSAAEVRGQVFGTLARLVRWVGLIFAAILVIDVVLTIGDANPGNGITRFVRGWADPLAWGFKDLFTPSDVKAAVLVNYGLAAVFWLVATAIVAGLIRRLGPADR